MFCSGGIPAFPAGITTPIVLDCCLPAGCYKLYVYDSAGDGFARAVVTKCVRQVLPDVASSTTSDNFSNGSRQQLVNSSQSFCLPIGDIDLINHSCDKLDWVNSTSTWFATPIQR